MAPDCSADLWTRCADFLKTLLLITRLRILLGPMAKTLPRINPVLCYLGDAFHLLNEALVLAPEQSALRAQLARSSSMHSLAALHAAANTALWSEEVKLSGDSTLARKFERLL